MRRKLEDNMRLIIFAFILCMTTAAFAETKPATDVTKAAVDDLAKRVYQAKLMQDRTNAELRRLKTEAADTKILEHKVETKADRETRIADERNAKMTEIAMNAGGALLTLILSFFGLGAWRNMSAKEKLRRIVTIADETWAAIEVQANKAAMTSAEKAKLGEKAAEEMRKLPHLKVRGNVDWKTLHAARSIKKA